MNPARPLDRLRIATPCSVSWEQMKGGDQVRTCDQCQLQVYNIAELRKSEAEALLSSTQGRICGRLYRRRDGTILTKDCPVGLRELRRRVSSKAAAIFAIVSSVATCVSGQSRSNQNKTDSCIAQTRVNSTVDAQATKLSGSVLDPQGAVVVGGKVVLQNVGTKHTQERRSNEEGKFDFGEVLAGKYLIKIQSPGFKKYQYKNFELKKNHATHIDVTLEDDAASVLIGIFSDEPSDPPGTKTITIDQIRRLPN